jgi:hypothetical protein
MSQSLNLGYNAIEFINERVSAVLTESSDKRAIVPERPCLAACKPLPDLFAFLPQIMQDRPYVVQLIGCRNQAGRGRGIF